MRREPTARQRGAHVLRLGHQRSRRPRAPRVHQHRCERPPAPRFRTVQLPTWTVRLPAVMTARLPMWTVRLPISRAGTGRAALACGL